MEKFIYAFSKEDANILMEHQFPLLYSDNAAQRYVFLNKGRMDFEQKDSIRIVLTDTLTFCS